MAKKPPERQKVINFVKLDHARVQDVKLPDLLKYLRDINGMFLGQDLHFSAETDGFGIDFTAWYQRDESDEEYDSRLERAREQKRMADEQAQRDAEREKRRAKWLELNKEFGR